jgi:transposase-like protein
MKKHTTPVPELASQKELNEFLLNNLNGSLTQAIKSTVSIMVKAEMQQIRAELGYPPQLSFNGYYGRNLVSPAGKIEDIPIARWREGNQNLPLASLNMFASEKDRFFELVRQLHLAGISQRKINRLCRQLFGQAVAPKTTQTVFAELLEQEAFQVNSSSLLDAPADFIFWDGLWQKVKNPKTGEVEERVVLAALGMRKGGEKKLLGFKLAYVEDEAAVKEFLASLEKRGLPLTAAKLFIADESKGILAGLDRIAPNVPVQICLAHRYRNVLKHTSHKHKKAMGIDLKKLTQTESREAFLQHVKYMQERWQIIAPKATSRLARLPHLLTAYFDFPPELWSKLRTTNVLERTFREVRARTVVNQHQFNSPASADRYHAATFGNLNQNYFM